MIEKVLVPVSCAAGAACVTLLSIGLAKLHKITKKLDKSIDSLSESSVRDIQESLVREAVEAASKRTVERYMASAHDSVMRESMMGLRNEIQKAVKDAEAEIRKSVSEEISAQASSIDMEALRRQVREKAEAKVLAKFDDNLEDILRKFSGSLGNVQQIYNSIASTIRGATEKKDEKEMTFRIG